MDLEISKWGRPVVWLARTEIYGGHAFMQSLFSSRSEAVKYAISNAVGSADWDNFPSRGSYPYEDRDGALDLDPVFRVTWDKDGGGKSEVFKCEVHPYFEAAETVEAHVSPIFQRIMERIGIKKAA